MISPLDKVAEHAAAAHSDGDVDVPILAGVSDVIKKVSTLIDKVAASDCSVLIEGETGTGKELAARRLHASSPRRGKPFIPVNCAGISETLFESQFFGHVRGAFTGAEQSSLGLVRSAEGGTLFMDEIAEVPLNLQSRLLRVLQDGEVMAVGTASAVSVDTRFVAATNRSLKEAAREGRFRQDLYYRLNVVRICLLPLRERTEDIPVLLDNFLAECGERYGRPVIRVGADVRRMLGAYPWPGNVRELMSWVERLYATGVAPEVMGSSLVAEGEALEAHGRDELLSLEDAERSAITKALEACRNNRTMAARVLGINRATLLRKIAHYQVA